MGTVFEESYPKMPGLSEGSWNIILEGFKDSDFPWSFEITSIYEYDRFHVRK